MALHSPFLSPSIKTKLAASAAVLLAAISLVSCQRPEPERSNVLVISIDSLRADRLKPWNAARGVDVPHIEGLAARGTLFRNAWSTSPWTAPSMVSVFTGLYPPSHGIVYRDDTTPRGLPTLSRRLEAEGYRLGNFSFFSQISYFRNLGLGPAEKNLRHGTVAKSFRRWLAAEDQNRPFFAWLHLLEPHLPYGATGYRATEIQIPGSSGLEQAQLQATLPLGSADFAPGDRETLLRLYDRDVEAADRAVGEILGALDEAGATASTLVVLVADHGEELLDEDWIGHASTAVNAKMIPQILRIPLILAGPGLPSGVVTDAMVQQTDVLPTLMTTLGLELPEVLDGQALQARWFWQDWPRGREFAFFDSSPGGNLTPADRRGERLQAVTDGRCLLSSATAPFVSEELRILAVDAPEGKGDCSTTSRDRLRAELDRWREKQGRQRLDLLGRTASQPTSEGAPSEEEVAGYESTLQLLSPADGARIERRKTSAQLLLEWQGEAEIYWIQYRVGQGPTEVEGLFAAEQNRIVFGPFPEGFWNELAAYGPFRFRVLDPAGSARSAWRTFDIVESRR